MSPPGSAITAGRAVRNLASAVNALPKICPMPTMLDSQSQSTNAFIEAFGRLPIEIGMDRIAPMDQLGTMSLWTLPQLLCEQIATPRTVPVHSTSS
jgi:hypothetical protein